VQSTEMSEEHQHDRPVAPQIAEPVSHAGGVGKRRIRQSREIHGGEPTVAGVELRPFAALTGQAAERIRSRR